MNILIYIPELNKDHVGGVWQYSTAVIKILAEDDSNSYFIYYNGDDAEILSIVSANPRMTQVTTNAVFKKSFATRLYRKIERTFAKLVDKNFIAPSSIDIVCNDHKIDIIHCPYQFIPVTRKAKLIATMHDVQEIHFPEYFSAKDRAYRANAYLDFITRADAVVVSYKHIRNDLVKYFQADEKKVHVILLDMQKLWFEQFAKAGELPPLPPGIPAKFLLYPANTWEHKNHINLIRAIALVKEKYGETIMLVCTGNRNAHYNTIEKLVAENKLQQQVYFEGVVPGATLYSLYRNCRGVVIPTLYEAGSFPLIESILMETPVICSNVTSLPETIGADEYLFDPLNVPQIADQLVRMWRDDEFRDKNLQHIKTRAQQIGKNGSLEKFKTLYASLA